MMKKLFVICIFTLISSMMFSAFPDWFKLKGRVIDATDGSALIGAKVLISNTNLFVYTQPDGTFEIDVQIDQLDQIVIEYISYENTSEVSYSEDGTYIFSLTPR